MTFRSRATTVIAVCALSIVGAISWPTIATGAPAHQFTKETLHFAVTVGPTGNVRCDIVGDLYKPVDATPSNRMPAIMTTNGFGLSKDNEAATGRLYASRGYVALAYSGLGFGGSTCKVTLDDPDYDGKAASQLISYLGGRSGIAFTDREHRNPSPPADFVKHDSVGHDGVARPDDPRVGMFGGSYGGQVQFAAASIDPRLDTIVPLITWNDLSYSLAPNGTDVPAGVSSTTSGATKLLWTIGFTGQGAADPRANGYLQDPSRAAGCPNFPAFVCATTVSALANGVLDPESIAHVRHASVSSYIDRIRIPTLLIQGEHDTLFDLNEARATYDSLSRQGTEVKMIWSSAGHSGGLVPGEIEYYTEQDPATQYLTGRAADWLDHYLKDSPVSTGPEFSYFRDWIPYSGNAAPAYRTAATVDVGTPRTMHLSGDGRLADSPQSVAKGAATLVTGPAGLPTQLSAPNLQPDPTTPEQSLPGTTAMWTTPAQSTPMDIVGAPVLNFTLSTDRPTDGSSAGAVVVFAKLYDVGPDGRAALVNGLVTPIRVLDPSKPVHARMPAIVHRFDTGHRLRIEIAGGDSNFRGGLLPFRVTVAGGAGQTLTVPVVSS